MIRAGLIVLSLFAALNLLSQKQTKIKLLKADFSNYDAQIAKDAQRLIGNVKFSHKESIMYCDSAWLYESDNRIKAFGNIKILRGDSLSLKGDLLDYNGDDQVANIYGNIRMTDKSMLLNTEHLIYDIENNTATYNVGGRITNLENDNILTSKIGSYYTNNEIFHFKEEVVLNNPEYVINTDTLHFHAFDNTAHFFGPTFIHSEENLIYCENGFYDTDRDISRFGDNAYVWFDGQQLSGDSLFYDRNSGLGVARSNVSIRDTVNQFEIKGDFGRHEEATEISYVTGNAEYIQLFDDDSLFLHADTLKSIPDTLSKNIIQCYNGARFFKNDLQGSCDSLIYSEVDSAFFLYDDPVVWSESNQISGDFIRLNTIDGGINDLYVKGNSFIISEIDSSHYNQIKGRNMQGYFNGNELVKIDVIGNGQLVYYPTEEKENGEEIVGINKAVCSDIQIRIKDKQITHVNLQNQTDSKFFPLNMASDPDKILAGFDWKIERRPLERKDIFK